MSPRVPQAVIMAGGEGSRLRPLTSNVPKPMLPVGNRPTMEHMVRLLVRHGFTEIVATVQFLSSVIRNYFDDGSDLGVSLSYAAEEVPMGTAGSVLGARDMLSGTFVVLSGDALTDIDIAKVVDYHRAREAAATLVLKRMHNPLEFGIVMTGEDGRIERFLEKPTWGQVFSDTINTGIYVLEPDVLDLIPPGQPCDFSAELFPAMLDKGLPIFGYVTDAYWADVGNIDAFLQTQFDVLDRRVDVELPGFEIRPGVWMGEDADIDPSARIEGPCLIGDSARVAAGASVGPYAVVGSNAIVRAEAAIAGGVIMDAAHVGRYAQVRGGVLGRGAVLRRGAVAEEGAVLGDEVEVGRDALIKPSVKVYPSRTVEAGAIVTQSIIQERHAHRYLFGSRGVAGLVNIGVTPQVAVRLGMAYGTTLKRGTTVVTGRDASRAARALKRALIAGLNSTGVNCQDQELTPLPLTRFTVRTEGAAGGISVRTSPGNPEEVEIRFFDPQGRDLPTGSQRKIERTFFREEYRRPGPHRLGELGFPAHAVEQYASGLLRAIDGEKIRAGEPKVVVDYAFGPASLIAPAILGRLGCEVLALNAFADEHRPSLTQEDLRDMLSRLAEHVRTSGSDVGVLLEPGGETAHLVDDAGRVVSPDKALLAFIRHEAARGTDRVAVPVSCSSACERVAEEAGATLQWSPVSLAGLMDRAARAGVGLAGNAEGALIFPRFMPAPDGLMTFFKALELLAVSGRRLSEIVDGLPPVHMARRDVPTPWQQKGAVMREVASSAGPSRLMLLDGVKVIEKDRWALVIPLADEPVCRIWTEASSPQGAEALADRYADVRRVGRASALVDLSTSKQVAE